MISCWNCNYRWFLSSSRWFSVYFFPGGLSSQWKCLKWMCKTSWTSALEWRETKNIGGHGQNSLKLQWYDIEIYWNQGQGGDFKDSLSYYILLIVLKLKPPTTGSKWCPWCVCVLFPTYYVLMFHWYFSTKIPCMALTRNWKHLPWRLVQHESITRLKNGRKKSG